MRRKRLVFSGMSLTTLVACVLLTAGVGLAASDTQVWRAHGGYLELEIRGDYLPDFGLEIEHDGRVVTAREMLTFVLQSIEPFELRVPYGNLEALETSVGSVRLKTGLTLRHGDRSVSLEELILTPATWRNHPAFVASDLEGRVMFTLTHLHIQAEHERDLLNIENAEVEASAFLAEMLDLEALAGLPIGLAWLGLNMPVPMDADTSGRAPGCDARPIWPQAGQFEAEVALIDMANVAYQGVEPGTGRVKIAPSATLKNISQADIPWFRQFTSSPLYPFEPRDQHPYLVWNLYRVMDGRIEMLAESGAKHAFFSINVNCDINCGNGNILWPGCEDVYSAGNNDTSTYQGPKDEIVASLGLWDNCGSFFDPDCTGTQTGFSGQWLNRLLVDPDEFQQPGASYFLDAWYVIQYDRNIWSTMGYRPVNPAPVSGGWTFNPGPFQQGPVIGEWVAEDDPDPLADHQLIVVPSATPDASYPYNMPQGHLRLLVRVTETAPGRYRYNYALQNYDFERGVDRLHIPLTSHARVFDSHFGGGPHSDDWSLQNEADGVSFIPPAGQAQPWFTLYNFEIETDAPPVQSRLSIGLAQDAVTDAIDIPILGPAREGPVPLIFHDRFENGRQ